MLFSNQNHQLASSKALLSPTNRIRRSLVVVHYIIFPLMLVWFAATPIEAWHGDKDDYVTHSTWMKDSATGGSIDIGLEQRPLSQVIIPMAHDALMGTAPQPTSSDGDAIVTQDLSVPELLEYGVRAFDIRFCPDQSQDGSDSNMYGCHGSIVLGLPAYKISDQSHEDIIQQISDFTFDPNHEKEVLIIRWNKTMCDVGSIWCPYPPTQGMLDKMCADFFNEFRDIIIEKPPERAGNRDRCRAI